MEVCLKLLKMINIKKLNVNELTKLKLILNKIFNKIKKTFKCYSKLENKVKKIDRLNYLLEPKLNFVKNKNLKNTYIKIR